jgi:hypothetical protein
MVVEVG